MSKKTVYDYHKELTELQSLTASMESTMEYIKSSFDIACKKNNNWPLEQGGMPSMALSCAESDLKRAHALLKKRQTFIEKKLASYLF